MIVLDTDVVSEALRPGPSDRVLKWLDEQIETDLFFSAIGLGELRSGVEVMPDRKRKPELGSRLSAFLRRAFDIRMLAYDAMAAERYALIVGDLRRKGRPASIADCQIAAIAMVHAFAVATRNSRPFIDAGLDVINPWEST